MNKPDSWIKVSSKPVAQCRVFDIRQDFCQRSSDQSNADFFVIECPDWVNVIAIADDEKFIFIEQYRQGVADFQIELAGGMIDAGEDPETAARRELLEETGYAASNWKPLGWSNPNPAIQNNRMFHFLATDCRRTADVKFDEHESINTMLLDKLEVDQLLRDGKIQHSLVLAAFAKLYLD